ncbi:MAG: porin [Polyangiaceae bacterium]
MIPTAALLTFASQTAAQNSETLDQGLSNSGSSVSNLLRNSRYDFGRGLTFTSQDGEASMNIGGQIQAGYSWSADDDNTLTSGWAVNSSRLRVGGQVRDGLTYFMQFDPQGGEAGNLVDAWVGWQVNKRIHLRLGQQKMRSGLSADTSANDTDFETVTRSIATGEFAGGRATGALVTGNAGMFNWHVGVMNNGTEAGTGQAQNTVGNSRDTDMSMTAGFSLGGTSEAWSEGDLTRSGASNWIAGLTVTQDNQSAVGDDFMTINAFAGFKAGNGLALQAELWSRDADDEDTTDSGLYVQGSYTLAANGSMQPGFVARVSQLDIDGADDGEKMEVLVGVNAYYAAHNLKTQLQVRQESDDGDDETTSLELMFTLVF